MTSGSSQGLFVIVAVVIFGIFVVISYLLFRDKLQTGLASIFSDSITQTNKDLIYKTNILYDSNFDGKIDDTNNANDSAKWVISHKGIAEKIDRYSLPDSVIQTMPSQFSKAVKVTQSTLADQNWAYLTQDLTKQKKLSNEVFPLEVGDIVTISAWVYIPDNVPANNFKIGTYNNWNDGDLSNISVRNSWVHTTYTTEIKNTNDLYFVVGIYSISNTKNYYFYCANMTVSIDSEAK